MLVMLVGSERELFMARTERILVEQFQHTAFPPPDPLAVAVALDPSIVSAETLARIYVDVHYGHGRGITALDLRHAHPNARVVTAVDETRFLSMIEAGWSAD